MLHLTDIVIKQVKSLNGRHPNKLYVQIYDFEQRNIDYAKNHTDSHIIEHEGMIEVGINLEYIPRFLKSSVEGRVEIIKSLVDLHHSRIKVLSKFNFMHTIDVGAPIFFIESQDTEPYIICSSNNKISKKVPKSIDDVSIRVLSPDTTKIYTKHYEKLINYVKLTSGDVHGIRMHVPTKASGQFIKPFE